MTASIEALVTQGKTIAVLSRDGGYVGHIAMRDELRRDAGGAVAALSALGVRSLYAERG